MPTRSVSVAVVDEEAEVVVEAVLPDAHPVSSRAEVMTAVDVLTIRFIYKTLLNFHKIKPYVLLLHTV
jgi:uncharacterized protein GlcG (DUF336 family)